MKKLLPLIPLILAVFFFGCSSGEVQPPEETSLDAKQEEMEAKKLSELARQKEAEELRKQKAEEERMRRQKEDELARLEEENRRLAEGGISAVPVVDAPLDAASPNKMISALQTVHFDYDKSDLRAESIEILNKNYEWIKGNPTVKIQLEGHCDERGTSEYNLALGERRARSVLQYLLSIGANKDQINLISYGEERPLASGHDESSWSKNRRVEFTQF